MPPGFSAGFYLEVLEVPSARKQSSATAPANLPSQALPYFPLLLQLCSWSGTLSDNWQAFVWLLIVILVGSGFQRAFRVLSGHLHLFLLFPEHSWHRSQCTVEKLRLEEED